MARQRGPSIDDVADGLARFIEGHIQSYVEKAKPVDDGPPLWVPIPNSPQVRALESPADELFFGGSGGGGKTDLLLGAALTSHKTSIIFRNEFTQLRGAQGIWERANQIIGVRGKPNESLFTWRDLPGGRALEFGAASSMAQAAKYRGRPHDLKGYDELPEMQESVYLFLNGWLRTSIVGQRTRSIATGNPPTTSDGQWVIKRWAPWLDRSHPNPAKDGELRWFVMIDGKDVAVPGPTEGWDRPDPVWSEKENKFLHPRSRTFIRSLVDDNPYYMATGYDKILEALPEPLRSQMRYGDFAATAADDPWQVIPTAWVIAAQARWTPDVPPVAPSCVGNDPSRGGKDEFVIAPRYGQKVFLEVHEATEAPDGPSGAALLFKAIGGNGAVPIQIDIIGSAGSSVYDHALGLKLRAVPMNASEKSEAKDKSGKLGFFNKRAEWWWKTRELLDPSAGHDLALPPDPQLRADLCSARWRAVPRGIQVEPKEDIKKRIGRSPDRGEAVIYALQDEHVGEEPLRLLAW